MLITSILRNDWNEIFTHTWYYRILNDSGLNLRHYNSKMADGRHLGFWKK